MSRAIITYADPANNDYKVRIPGIGLELSAQCVTLDALELGDEVVMADIDNLPPSKVRTKGKIRILPSRGNYTYNVDSRWYTAQEVKALGKQASLMYSYVYSSDRNPSWQKEKPLYRKGTITKIHDSKYVDVNITYPWRGNITETKRCRVDYMTCDTVAFAVGDIVLIKFVNSDPRRPYVVGKWDEPGLCDAYLYCAVKIDRRITDFGSGGVSESSESSLSSSSSQESKSSESASSYSEGIKGLDDYYAFVWNPKVNDFAVINDPVTELPIQFPCRAERLESWLLSSSNVTQTTMLNRRAGTQSMLTGAGWGASKRWFLSGNWRNFIECLGANETQITIGGDPDYTKDDCTPLDDCSSPSDCVEAYWTDYYKNIWAKCGTYESGVINKANSLTGGIDSASFAVTRTCTGANGDQRLAVAGASLDAALIPSDGSNHDAFSSYTHELDGFQVGTITTEDIDVHFEQDFNHSPEFNEYVDVEYSTETFLGGLYSNWQLREFDQSGWTSNYYAQAILSQTFVIGRRCSAGTFVWLGLQGATLRADNWGDPFDVPWVIQSKHNYALAYCDTGTYGEDPFTSKSNNSRISDVIKQIINKFYQEDAGGAVLEFDVDVRWVSGAIEAYSSVSSSSNSSSSSSSSSLSESKSSVSSSSESSLSSESIP